MLKLEYSVEENINVFKVGSKQEKLQEKRN